MRLLSHLTSVRIKFLLHSYSSPSFILHEESITLLFLLCVNNLFHLHLVVCCLLHTVLKTIICDVTFSETSLEILKHPNQKLIRGSEAYLLHTAIHKHQRTFTLQSHFLKATHLTSSVILIKYCAITHNS